MLYESLTLCKHGHISLSLILLRASRCEFSWLCVYM